MFTNFETKMPFDLGDYTGQIYDDMPYGEGKLFHHDRVYIGQFEEGHLEGQGKIYENKSEIYDGSFERSEMEGYGKEYK